MLSLFFVPVIDTSPKITVSGDEAHHAITVTRLGVGERVALSDGSGAWAIGVITSADKKSFTVEVSERGVQELRRPLLTVVQALPKSDRVKEALELIVEAGADRIIPWAATRSISKWQDDSQSKWQTTSMTAAKQSRRYFIPQVLHVHSAKELTSLFSTNTSALVLHEEGAQPISSALTHAHALREEIFLVIGPEGGITPEEIQLFQSAGAEVVRLGEPILRSAHAAIAGLAAVQALIGRW
jgi:16S rRNA (uracil1498-N3)-methyltransferase